MDVTVEGMLMRAKLKQPLNIDSGMDVSAALMVIAARFLQLRKASFPIEVTVEGMVRLMMP